MSRLLKGPALYCNKGLAMNSRRRAFTLVELLVVLGIIAVLLALLMPVLARSRREARGVVCLSNLRQLGSLFHGYLSENKGKAPTWLGHGPLDLLQIPRNDHVTFPQLPFCPEAPEFGTRVTNGGQVDFYEGAAYDAWGVWYARAPAVEVPWWGLRGSSYGMNRWALSPDGRSDRTWLPLFVSPGTKQSDSAPLFADAVTPVCWVRSTDTPPDNLTKPNVVENGQQIGMRGVCIARHRRAINIVFLDGHARRVPLEDLWKLRWTNQWSPTDVTLPPG